MDLDDLSRRMHGAVSALKTELGGLRTGRASASLLEPIHVDAYGSVDAAQPGRDVSVPEPRMISVQVWDKSMVGAVDRAIRESNLGLNPIVEGTLLRIPIPELNAERRKELVKVAHKYAEQRARRGAPCPPRRHRPPEEGGEGRRHERGRPEAACGPSPEADRRDDRRDRRRCLRQRKRRSRRSDSSTQWHRPSRELEHVESADRRRRA